MREYKLYLDDILKAIKKIEKYTKGLTLKQIMKNELVVDGVARNLEVIGEAVKNIPIRIKERHPEVEWRKIAGLRDILTHKYFSIDLEVLWDIVENKLPIFKKQILHISQK